MRIIHTQGHGMHAAKLACWSSILQYCSTDFSYEWHRSASETKVKVSVSKAKQHCGTACPRVLLTIYPLRHRVCQQCLAIVATDLKVVLQVYIPAKRA